LREDDFKELFSVASDPKIWEQHPARDRYQRPVFQEFFKSAILSGGALIIEDSTTTSVIGSSRFANYSSTGSEVEIGWTFLARSYWGGKHNSAVKTLMLEHAFKAVDSVLFKVGAQNVRSQKAVLKLGAVQEGMITAVEAPGLCYRLTRATYRALNTPSPPANRDA
jgi:RimJ/RimL family protein N-acetyltransferase